MGTSPTSGDMCSRPLQYFGLSDNTDLSSVTWSRQGGHQGEPLVLDEQAGGETEVFPKSHGVPSPGSDDE